MSYFGVKDIMLEIPRGLISNMSSINKFGNNPDIEADTVEDVWDGGGDYPFTDTVDITHISEDSDQVADRGVLIEVQGLDSNWDLVVQTKNLDVTDSSIPVELDTPLIRVFRMKVLANIILLDNVTISNIGVTVIYGIISAGNNQTLMSIYTVPRNKTAYMVSYYCDYVRTLAKDPDAIDYTLKTADRLNDYEFQIKSAKGVPGNGVGFQHFFNPYFKVTEMSDLEISARPGSKDADVHSGFDLILVDN